VVATNAQIVVPFDRYFINPVASREVREVCPKYVFFEVAQGLPCAAMVAHWETNASKMSNAPLSGSERKASKAWYCQNANHD
jgi:hypothetical protein